MTTDTTYRQENGQRLTPRCSFTRRCEVAQEEAGPQLGPAS